MPKWMGPRNCINSSLVEEITVQDSAIAKNQIIELCSLKSRSFSEPPPNWLRGQLTFDRIEWVETLASLWERPDHKIKLVISNDDDVYLSYRDESLQIGRSALEKPGVLERALISYWIGLRDTISSQIATDLIWSIMGKSPSQVNFSFQSWTELLVSLKSYCGKSLNILQHEEFCQIQRNLGDGLVVGQKLNDEDQKAVHWALHIAATKYLRQAFDRMPLTRKKTFLEGLIFINRIEDETLWSKLDQMGSVEELDQVFWSYVLQITSSLGVEESELWEIAKPSMIQYSNYPVNYMVLNSGLSWSLPIKPTNPAAKTSEIIIEQVSDKYLFPSDVPLHFSRQSVFDNREIESVTIVDCVTPQPKKVLEFDPYVRRVLYVRICEDSKDHLKDLLSMGADRFVQKHKDIEYIEFNLSALRLAQRTKGNLQGSTKIEDWSHWLDWQKLDFDQEKSAFRPRAVIDAINSFRIIN